MLWEGPFHGHFHPVTRALVAPLASVSLWALSESVNAAPLEFKKYFFLENVLIIFLN